ncbi:alpha-1,2-fucosyltransferase [Streptomyces sp. NP160]|uniref:alpha-1,2-fucosyltransferase n=1 Tax=Streptomyces sp. NP160 TaxID=2586637 RepID=UPI0011194554|nr:alpha-1,2-fucosyltransferase [Streptomyces sp. NP160]TNM69376.1 alpha-1,2-fucosyltransferase [Streptomyces sp. NP160]
MTIAQVEGGLASQMFGYAAARRLALKHGADVLIDPRNYRTYTKFQLELHHFDVQAVLLSPEQADEICGRLDEAVTVVRPRHLHVDQAVLELDRPHVLMKGNYVSEDYFHDVEDVLRRDFRRTSLPTEYAAGARAAIDAHRARGGAPVAVHVRRGDYVSEAHTNRFHGTCTLDYYARARDVITRTVEDPWFFVFSDDPEWCKTRFSGSRTTVFHAPPGTPPVEDMLLMAACDHHVIANSTYSWWGAWLGKTDRQVVIGPRPFLADRTHNTDDILPRHWLTLGASPSPGHGAGAARADDPRVAVGAR